jgi:hypothetical protein
MNYEEIGNKIAKLLHSLNLMADKFLYFLDYLAVCALAFTRVSAY